MDNDDSLNVYCNYCKKPLSNQDIASELSSHESCQKEIDNPTDHATLLYGFIVLPRPNIKLFLTLDVRIHQPFLRPAPIEIISKISNDEKLFGHGVILSGTFALPNGYHKSIDLLFLGKMADEIHSYIFQNSNIVTLNLNVTGHTQYCWYSSDDVLDLADFKCINVESFGFLN